ncbi:MAG: chromosome segregation protein SMC, partial [Acidimicrobiales bacterium]
MRREVELAKTEAASAATRSEAARRDHDEARRAVSAAGRRFEAASAERRQCEARLAAVRRQLDTAGERFPEIVAALGVAEDHAGRIARELDGAEAQLRRCEVAERSRREEDLAAAAAQAEIDEAERELTSMAADLGVRSTVLDERRSLLARRGEAVRAQIAGHEAARAAAAHSRAARQSADAVLAGLEGVVGAVRDELVRRLAELRQEASRRSSEATATLEALRVARRERTGIEGDLAGTRERAQRVEIERTELRVRLEATTETVRHELDAEPSEAMEAPCPELPPGIPATARARELERDLRLMGPINPLAVEELAALDERDCFLSSQLEDVRAARRELGRVMKAVNEEIVAAFTEAFADVAGHFEALFETLFPGGSGRLSLTDPTDLLSTGVEIEARPAGRNVRRLSLLSGGERSLVALAFLFAVFRSRPSPFYLMDEVEAALDDVNLHRFLDLMGEF